MEQCKPLPHGLPNHMPQGEIKAKFQFLLVQAANGGIRRSDDDDGRGLHSSTVQLNLSRFWHKSTP